MSNTPSIKLPTQRLGPWGMVAAGAAVTALGVAILYVSVIHATAEDGHLWLGIPTAGMLTVAFGIATALAGVVGRTPPPSTYQDDAYLAKLERKASKRRKKLRGRDVEIFVHGLETRPKPYFACTHCRSFASTTPGACDGICPHCTSYTHCHKVTTDEDARILLLGYQD